MPRKLVIQIPCFNEEATLPLTVSGLPRAVAPFTSVEYLVIDDGSTDRTVAVAREVGVHHVVRLDRHRGLAAAFLAGLKAAVECDADVIVNTDGDNQYAGGDIARLVAPILDGRAHVVIGERNIAGIDHFSWCKKLTARLGSWVVSRASGLAISDAPSGFRALSRRAATELQLVDEYSHTLETIIQAGWRGIPLTTVPIGVNAKTRESRLARSSARYVARSAFAIVRSLWTYALPRLAAPFSIQGSRYAASRWTL
jgi:glycosyltransferase involved in cell wall biosynthesis